MANGAIEFQDIRKMGMPLGVTFALLFCAFQIWGALEQKIQVTINISIVPIQKEVDAVKKTAQTAYDRSLKNETVLKERGSTNEP